MKERHQVFICEGIADKRGNTKMYGTTIATGISWSEVLIKIQQNLQPMPPQVRTRHITVFVNKGKQRNYLTERLKVTIVNNVPFLKKSS